MKLDSRYTAGLIDGEGCLRVCQQLRHTSSNCRGLKLHRYSAWVGLHIREEEMINHLYDTYGGNIGKRIDKRSKNYAPIHWWILSGGKRSKPFLEDIFDHLILKKRQAGVILRLINETQSTHWSIKNPMPDEIYKLQQDLYIQALNLNARGQDRSLNPNPVRY